MGFLIIFMYFDINTVIKFVIGLLIAILIIVAVLRGLLRVYTINVDQIIGKCTQNSAVRKLQLKCNTVILELMINFWLISCYLGSGKSWCPIEKKYVFSS